MLISNFGRALGITKRIAKRLPTEPPVLELDVTDDEHLAGLRRPGARARRRARRRRALDRLRQPGDAARRQVPRRAVGRRRAGGAGLGVLAEVAGHGLPAADVARRLGRRADLRRDGRRGRRTTGWAWPRPALESTLALPRPRPRAPTGIRCNLVSAGSAQDAGRQGDPRLRGPRVDVEATAPRSAGTTPTTRPTARAVVRAAVATSSRPPPARSCTSTAASTRWVPDRPEPLACAGDVSWSSCGSSRGRTSTSRARRSS